LPEVKARCAEEVEVLRWPVWLWCSSFEEKVRLFFGVVGLMLLLLPLLLRVEEEDVLTLSSDFVLAEEGRERDDEDEYLLLLLLRTFAPFSRRSLRALDPRQPA